MTGGSGPTSHVPFAFYDPDSCCWRTSQPFLDGECPPFSGTLPRSGSMRGGSLFALPMSVPLISALASSSRRGLPTPRAQDWKAGGKDGLEEELRTLPTPRTTDANGAGSHGQGGPDLRTVVSLLPTPTVNDSRGGRNKTANRTDPASTHHDGTTLTDAIRLLPTPTATPYGNNQSPTPGAAVRPSLESLIPALSTGPPLPTPAPSTGGKPS